jgi:hypothetical protein
MNTYGGWICRSTYSSTWHWLEVSGQLLAWATLPSGKEPPVSIGWMGPRTGLVDGRGEKCFPYRDSNSDPSAVQPVACRYTDCALPAPVKIIYLYIVYYFWNETKV